MAKQTKKTKEAITVPYKEAREAFTNMNASEKGDMLTAMLKLHKKKQTQEAYMAVLRCLMDDIPVGVPMKISEEDAKMIREAKAKNQKVELGKVKMQPAVMKHPTGGYFLPVFSRIPEVDADYYRQHFWIQLPFTKCIKIVLNAEVLNGIVINVFTQGLTLPQNSLKNILDAAQLRPTMAAETAKEAEAAAETETLGEA